MVSLVSSQGWGLIDLPLRTNFSPAHPLARQDVPLTRARVFGGHALREQRRSSGSIPPACANWFKVRDSRSPGMRRPPGDGSGAEQHERG